MITKYHQTNNKRTTQNDNETQKQKCTDTKIFIKLFAEILKVKPFYLVDFFIYSLHLISFNPLRRDVKSELLVFILHEVINTF